MNKTLYFECHITLDPVFEDKLETLKELCLPFGYKVASLLMKKREQDAPTMSMYDTFTTGHKMKYEDAEASVKAIVPLLLKHGYNVRRYKIEDVIIDSRNEDLFKLLFRTS